jgi:hypothetical protein
MSGPQGSDPTQPWPGQQPPQNDPQAWQQPPAPEQPAGDTPAWQQPPAYSPQQYPQYQAPQQQYPQPDQYGQQPTAYGPTSYQPQPDQYGQPQYGQPQYGQPQYGQPQYGQPGQPGQPQYGQQPGQQFSPYGTTGSDEASKKSMKVLLGVGGGIALLIVVVVLILGFVAPGWFVSKQLDVNAAQSGVAQVLSDETNGYGAKNVSDVLCNKGQNPEVKKGDTFTCDVSIDGTKRRVTVTFQDDDGTYEVGRPK